MKDASQEVPGAAMTELLGAAPSATVHLRV